MNKITELSIVVPVYRNEDTLELLCDRLEAAFRPEKIHYELIFVNDASPDNAWQVIVQLCRRFSHIKGLSLTKNMGQHQAVLVGLGCCKGQYCLIMDADLQDTPESAVFLWRQRSAEFSAIFGGRAGHYESRGRLLTSRIFKTVLHWVCGIPADAGIYVLMRRNLVEKLLSMPVRTPFINAMIGCAGVKMRSIPVERVQRHNGDSAYSGFGRLISATKALRCVWEFRFSGIDKPFLQGLSFEPVHQRCGSGDGVSKV